MVSNQQRAQALAARIAAQVQRGANKGLSAVRPFLVARIKEALSVPAPRKRVGTNPIRYVATTKATPGAPPRKLSGRLRTSITGSILIGTGKLVKSLVVGSNVIYARRHELGTHPFLVPTVERYKSELATMIGQKVRLYVAGKE